MQSEEEIEDSIENTINNDELFSIQEIKYLLNNHINTTFYNDTAIEVLNKSTLQYIEQLETREQKLINYLESKNINTIEKEGQEPCEIYKSKKATIEIDEILKIVEGFIEDYKIAKEVAYGNLIDSLETILSTLKEKDKKLEEKDRIINLMDKKINEAYFEENKFCIWFEDNIVKKENGKFNNSCFSDRINKIKQYFEKKVEEV